MTVPQRWNPKDSSARRMGTLSAWVSQRRWGDLSAQNAKAARATPMPLTEARRWMTW